MPSRVAWAPVAVPDKLFPPEFNDCLVALHDALDGRARQLRAAREALLKAALDGKPVTHLPPSEATTGTWKVPPRSSASRRCACRRKPTWRPDACSPTRARLRRLAAQP